MITFKRLLAAGVIADVVCASLVPMALAGWRETVTFSAEGNLNSGARCLMFQTVEGGGVVGIDNSSGGDSAAPGFTGGAVRYGVGLGTSSPYNALGADVVLKISTSRYSSGLMKLSFDDYGLNNGIYADCSANVHAVGRFGQ